MNLRSLLTSLGIRGYFGSMHRDGLAGSWGGHAVVSLLLTIAGTVLASVGFGWIAVLVVALLFALLLKWGERSWPMIPPAVVALAMAWAWSFTPMQGGVMGAGVALAFYWERENANKSHLLRLDKYTMEKRLDRVGDLLGAASIFAATVVMYLAGTFL